MMILICTILASPAHQSEMAKMLAEQSGQLKKVGERPAPVMDSRSELLQAIRAGEKLLISKHYNCLPSLSL